MKSSRKVSKLETSLALAVPDFDKDGMTPKTCKAARALLDLTQAELAELAKVTPLTIRKYEKGKTGLAHRTWLIIRSALQKAGIIFLDEDDAAGSGVRLRKGKK